MEIYFVIIKSIYIVIYNKLHCYRSVSSDTCDAGSRMLDAGHMTLKHKDRRFDGAVMETYYVKNIMGCMKLCLVQCTCVSINVKRLSQNQFYCEVNDRLEDDYHPVSIVVATGFNYYQINT